MAKQTGQITVLKNNKVTNVEHQIRFIFTKKNGERITRDTTSKGVINFDIPNGEWNVSWFAVDGDQKVLPLRAGLQLKITSSTPTTALADWIYGDNTHVADPILAQWTTVLDEMKSVRDEFRKETQQDGTGKFVMQSSVKKNFLDVAGRYTAPSNDVPILKQGDSGLAMGRGFLANNPGLDFSSVGANEMFLYYEIQLNFGNSNLVATFKGYNSPILLQATKRQGEAWSTPVVFYGSQNTIIDSNGFIKSASPIIKLFDDRIETNSQFKEEPVFEKIGVGTYKISNTLGLAKEGWTYEKPRGKDGNPYFHIKVDKLEDGCIISVHDVYEALEEATITDIDGNERKINKVVKILGEARDIKPHERWIDLRFHEDPEEIEEMEEEQSDLERHLEENNAVLLQERK